MQAQSNRKPFNNRAGYRASLRSGKDRGYVVIYEADAQGIDVGGLRYAVVCETHSTICGASSMPKARDLMKHPTEFCECCDDRCLNGVVPPYTCPDCGAVAGGA